MQVVLFYLSHFISKFTPEMCPAAKNCEKFNKTPYFGGSRSFNVIDVDNFKSLLPMLIMISSKSVPICNCFYAI